MALTKVSTGVVDMSGSTGALEIARGTTATRPATPPVGTLRSNTSTNKMEVYTSTVWRVLKEGGKIFTPLIVDYLVVAGGGGGGSSNGASGSGGGAGEYLYKTAQTLLVATTYTVSVGVNGIGGSSSGGGAYGTSGANSLFNNDITRGGGYGIMPNSAGNGGSGGSGGGANYPARPPGSSTAVSPGLGNAGGNGFTTGGGGGGYGSGGGGGAGQPGFAGTSYVGGNGGNGISNNITGTSTPYAAGGGGGLFGPSGQSTVGIGGSSGTGGSSSLTANASAGAASTGSGGGGGSYTTSSSPYVALSGGNGGSGVVILKYPNAYQINFTAGANPAFSSTNATVGTDTVTIIIAGSGTITFSSIP